MRNLIKVIELNNEGISIYKNIEVLISFKIEELNKHYVNYLNPEDDDGKSKNIETYIAEVDYFKDIPLLKPIPKEDALYVSYMYNTLKKEIVKKNKKLTK